MSIPKESARHWGDELIISTTPDFCYKKVGNSVVVIAPTISAELAHAEATTSSVRMTGRETFTMKSHITCCKGDAQGDLKGIKSGTIESICEPIGHSGTVRAEGACIVRDGDTFYMNSCNCTGVLQCKKDMGSYEVAQANVATGGQQVMSDASPAGKPGSGVPAKPRPSAEIIDFETWRKAAGRPSNTPTGGVSPGNLLKWGGRASGIGTFFTTLLTPSPLAENPPPWEYKSSPSETQNDIWKEAKRLAEAGEDIDEIDAWVSAQEANNAELIAAEQGKESSVATSQNVRSSSKEEEEEEDSCIVGPYSAVKKACGDHAHHIIPDRVYRLGKRDDPNRIPNAPTLNEGMAVCLTKPAHTVGDDAIHKGLDDAIEALGYNHTPQGTAPVKKILGVAKKSIDDVKELSEECKKKAKALVTAQANPLGSQPGRTPKRRLPSPEALIVLKRGYY